MIGLLQGILADIDSAGQLLIVIAVILFSVFGAMMEKLKKKTAEGQKRPPVIPPPTRRTPPQRPDVTRRPVPIPQQRQGRSPQARGQTPSRPRGSSAPAAPPMIPTVATVGQPAARRPVPPSTVVIDEEVETRTQVGAHLPSATATRTMAQLRAEPRSHEILLAVESFRHPSPEELRRAIVLNEILGLPVALREGADSR